MHLDCVNACPVDAIHPKPGEASFGLTDQLFIDPATCVDCGQCAAVCPANAIFPSDQVPAQWQAYIQINAEYYG
jgi:NAD-dependent dihydropyrimidine dehydrogenase PreA subunit